MPAFAPFSFGEDANCDLYLAAGNSVDRIIGSAASAPPACASAPPPAAQAPTGPVTVKNKCKRKRSGPKGKRCKKASAQFGFASTVTSSR